MDKLSVIQKSRALRLAAKETESMPFSAEKTIRTALEHHELLKLSYQMEAEIQDRDHKLQAMQDEHATLIAMVYEHVRTLQRDTTGFPWREAFKNKSQAFRHFQSGMALARFLKPKNPRP